jgi:hypothetical protein
MEIFRKYFQELFTPQRKPKITQSTNSFTCCATEASEEGGLFVELLAV